MFETFWYETERLLRGTAVFAVIVSVYAGFAVALFPSIEAASVDLQKLLDSYPEPLRAAFGVEAIGTIEGFLAGELYNFVWVLLLGVYFAYRGGGIIASDIERGRMDLLLSFPISRPRLLFEKYASLLVPMGAVNAVAGVTVYLGSLVINFPIDPIAVFMVHVLSLPYLLSCAALGLALSVLTSRADVAQRAALGIVFFLYLLESLAASTEHVTALKYLSPTYYYAPTDILVRGRYPAVDSAVLLGFAVVLIALSGYHFARRDI